MGGRELLELRIKINRPGPRIKIKKAGGIVLLYKNGGHQILVGGRPGHSWIFLLVS